MIKGQLKKDIECIAGYYGFWTQATKLAEEGAELSAALCKMTYLNRRVAKGRRNIRLIAKKKEQAKDDFLKELADVLVVAEGIKFLLEADLFTGAEVSGNMRAKVQRQLERIKEEVLAEEE
ncbi:hypothetical protein [Turicimonas muris]|uniref:hypothetical protein n=1 Tax=Turicimonas muris TaxID=1796652 RepID=UPI00249431C5|nr:hypothetical protein [Turicimonas muris]